MPNPSKKTKKKAVKKPVLCEESWGVIVEYEGGIGVRCFCDSEGEAQWEASRDNAANPKSTYRVARLITREVTK